MIFTSLQSLLTGGALSLTLTGNADNTITVLVVPKGEGALAQPLMLTASAEELDEKFVECLSSYSAERKSLAEQMESTAAVLAAAKSESAGKAVKALSKASAASTVKDKAIPGSSDEDDEENTGEDTPPPASASPSGEPAVAPDNLFL